MVFLNPVPEKARFITDYVVVTNGEGGAVNTALDLCEHHCIGSIDSVGWALQKTETAR